MRSHPHWVGASSSRRLTPANQRPPDASSRLPSISSIPFPMLFAVALHLANPPFVPVPDAANHYSVASPKVLSVSCLPELGMMMNLEPDVPIFLHLFDDGAR